MNLSNKRNGQNAQHGQHLSHKKRNTAYPQHNSAPEPLISLCSDLHTHTHTHTITHTQTKTNLHTYKHMHTYAKTHTHKRNQKHKHKLLHTLTHYTYKLIILVQTRTRFKRIDMYFANSFISTPALRRRSWRLPLTLWPSGYPTGNGGLNKCSDRSAGCVTCLSFRKS